MSQTRTRTKGVWFGWVVERKYSSISDWRCCWGGGHSNNRVSRFFDTNERFLKNSLFKSLSPDPDDDTHVNLLGLYVKEPNSRGSRKIYRFEGNL